VTTLGKRRIVVRRNCFVQSFTVFPNASSIPKNGGFMRSWRRVIVEQVKSMMLIRVSLLGMVAAVMGAMGAVEASTPQRLSLEIGAAASFSDSILGPAAIVSPDGQLLVFVAQKADGEKSQLYIRKLTKSRATPLSGTEGADSPFFSPDGKWIGFFAGGQLKKIAVAGGAPLTICAAGGDGTARGGSWTEDGFIFFTPHPRAALFRVRSDGGSPEPLTKLDSETGEVTHRWPQALLGGRAVMFTANSQTGDFEDANIVVQSLPDGPRKIVQRAGYNGRYLGSGHLVFMHDGMLLAASFDLDQLTRVGEPVPALAGVAGMSAFGGAHFAFSTRGALVFVPGAGMGLTVPIQWMDRQGGTKPLRAVPAFYNHPRFSPDGRQLVVEIRERGIADVWIYDWERDHLSRLTADAGDNRYPIWTPDGRRIAFGSTRKDNSTRTLYWQRVNGGAAEPLTQSGNAQMPTSWHPGGKFLAFEQENPQSGMDIMILPVEGDEASGWKPGKPTVFFESSFHELNAVFSPDGRWLAYQSNESGSMEVYVRPFPGPGEKMQVSSGGGMYPTWSRSSKELIYQHVEDWTLMVAAYTTEGDSLRAERPRRLARIPRRGFGMPGFDLHPDGQRFAVLKAAEETTDIRQDHMVLIPHFFDELRRVAP
jgi:Tol biopolymer transport system component